MALRAIDFPDHTDPNFNEDEPFEAPNGITYTWNGYGWEVSCGFGDPECQLDVETELLAYAAGTDLAEGQAFVYANGFYWKGDQSGFIEDDQEFKVGTDTFTVSNIEVIEDPTHGEFTKVDTVEDPTGLIGQTLEVEGFCAPIGKRYLLAHGDDVRDCDGPAVYQWNKPVTLTVEQSSFDKSRLEISENLVELVSAYDLRIYADDKADIFFDTGALHVGGQKELVFDYDGTKLVNEITDSTVPKHVVDKKYVNEQDELLRQDIIELEEEINAIAPSLEYGTWKYEEPSGGNVSRPPSTGTFYLMNGAALTSEYLQTTNIKIHNNEYVAPGDTDPVDNHTWADADVGELIQLFDAADPDFFLGKITAKNVDPVGEFVNFTVERVQSSGVPNDNADPVTGEYLTRINVFKEPSGGNASEFVLKQGDEMTGELNLRTEQSDGNNNYTVPSIKDKHLRLSTTRTDTDSTRHAYLFQPGYSEDLMSSRHFISGSNIYTKASFLGYSSTGGTNFTTLPVRLNLYSNDGGLYWNGTGTSNRRVYLNNSAGWLYYNGKYSAAWDDSGFYAYYQNDLRFNTNANGTVFEHPIFVHGNNCRIKAQNSSGTATSGTYGTAGQVLTSQGNAPPRWKDAGGASNYVRTNSSGFSGNMTITKSSGVYYITGG